MNARQKTKLKKLIDNAAKANTVAFEATTKLNNFCEEVWGFAPADHDIDAIIDGVLGGCGSASGMSVEDFIREMEREI